jgi:hypothetical protein
MKRYLTKTALLVLPRNTLLVQDQAKNKKVFFKFGDAYECTKCSYKERKSKCSGVIIRPIHIHSSQVDPMMIILQRIFVARSCAHHLRLPTLEEKVMLHY